MKNKVIVIVSIFIILAAVISYVKLDFAIPDFVNVFENQPSKPTTETKSDPEEISVPPQKRTTFSGRLEEVNVGCFADATCSVVVGGKSVTVLVGRSREVVGKVEGVNGVGALEDFIGEEIEVYAQNLGENNYTLYGDDKFYIKPMDAGTATLKINESATVFGVTLTPLEVLEDSRCPIDVQCIQAGTVRVVVKIESEKEVSEQELSLRELVKTEKSEITLVQVNPITDSKSQINLAEYTFTFKIKNI